MKLITYRDKAGNIAVGLLSASEKSLFKLPYNDMNELISSHTDIATEYAHLMTREGDISVSDITLLAPIPCPKQDIICLGINYMDHAAESARYKKEAFGGERPFAVYFSKRVNEAVGSGSTVTGAFDIDDAIDYEAELAVIIGTDARNVTEENAEKYIFGYTVLNDLSARNIQTRHKQWYFGKSLDGFTPMGPCIVTADSISFPPKLSVKSIINGELRQNGNTENLIFSISHIIAELSHGMTLKAGTVISTGTPSGAGMGFSPPRFLKPGDTVECFVDGIGSLITKFK